MSVSCASRSFVTNKRNSTRFLMKPQSDHFLSIHQNACDVQIHKVVKIFARTHGIYSLAIYFFTKVQEKKVSCEILCKITRLMTSHKIIIR